MTQMPVPKLPNFDFSQHQQSFSMCFQLQCLGLLQFAMTKTHLQIKHEVLPVILTKYIHISTSHEKFYIINQLHLNKNIRCLLE
jgi:hypothetical protein